MSAHETPTDALIALIALEQAELTALQVKTSLIVWRLSCPCTDDQQSTLECRMASIEASVEVIQRNLAHLRDQV